MRIKLLYVGSLFAILFSFIGSNFSYGANYTTLKGTVEKALRYNPKLKATQENKKTIESDIKQAKSHWLPRVDAQVGWGIGRWENPSFQNSSDTLHNKNIYYDRSQAKITISQIIWDGMKTWNEVTLNEHKLNSATNTLYDAAEEISLKAILAHIEVYRQHKIVQLAKMNVQNHKNIFESQKKQLSSGESNSLEIAQSQSRLAMAKATLMESISAFEQASANYKRLTGSFPRNLESPKPPLKTYKNLDSVLAKVKNNNLKILAQKSNIESATSKITMDKSIFYPQIYLEAGPSYSWRTQGQNTYQWENGIMLYANWNFFSGGKDWATIKKDKAIERQSKQELFALVDSLVEETTATWSILSSAKEQTRYYTEAVNYSTTSRDMYIEQFNTDQKSLLNILDTENELFITAIQLVTAQQKIYSAQYKLLALGGELLSALKINYKSLESNAHNTAE